MREDPMETLSVPVSGRHFKFVELAAIRANPNNAREHDSKQIEKHAESIKNFGFLSPVLIDENGMLLCGHARAEAAIHLAAWPKTPEWLLRITGALPKPSSVALVCRWRRRPQHQERKSVSGIPTQVLLEGTTVNPPIAPRHQKPSSARR